MQGHQGRAISSEPWDTDKKLNECHILIEQSCYIYMGSMQTFPLFNSAIVCSSDHSFTVDSIYRYPYVRVCSHSLLELLKFTLHIAMYNRHSIVQQSTQQLTVHNYFIVHINVQTDTHRNFLHTMFIQGLPQLQFSSIVS